MKTCRPFSSFLLDATTALFLTDAVMPEEDTRVTLDSRESAGENDVN